MSQVFVMNHDRLVPTLEPDGTVTARKAADVGSNPTGVSRNLILLLHSVTHENGHMFARADDKGP